MIKVAAFLFKMCYKKLCILVSFFDCVNNLFFMPINIKSVSIILRYVENMDLPQHEAHSGLKSWSVKGKGFD